MSIVILYLVNVLLITDVSLRAKRYLRLYHSDVLEKYENLSSDDKCNFNAKACLNILRPFRGFNLISKCNIILNRDVAHVAEKWVQKLDKYCNENVNMDKVIENLSNKDDENKKIEIKQVTKTKEVKPSLETKKEVKKQPSKNEINMYLRNEYDKLLNQFNSETDYYKKKALVDKMNVVIDKYNQLNGLTSNKQETSGPILTKK